MSQEPLDVAIVGGGVGGVAAALWCERLALRCVLLEKSEQLGGQLHHIHNVIPDYPGVLCDGKTFAAQLAAQLEQLRIVPQLKVEVQGVELDVGRLRTSAGDVEARAIIAATGLERRRLEVPGASSLRGAGVAYTFSGARETFEGQRVCVIGSGDGAFENALMLAEVCPLVHLVMRKRQPKARIDFVCRVLAHPRIHLHRESALLEILGAERVEGVRLQERGEVQTLQVEAVLIKIGWQPVVGWLGGGCELSAHQTLVVDAGQRTSHPRVWAVGDICTPHDPSISVAVGQACIAVREIKRALSQPHIADLCPER